MEDNKAKNRMRLIGVLLYAILYWVAYLLLFVGVILFLNTNKGVFANAWLINAVFVLCIGILPIGYLLSIKHKKGEKLPKVVSLITIVIAIVMFLIILLKGVIIDIFQPLALNTSVSVILIVSVVVLLIASLISILVTKDRVLSLFTAVMLIATMSTGLIIANAQGYGEFTKIEGEPVFLFEDGESGYATFRIPSILAINHNVLNQDRENEDLLTTDVLIVMAEGRKNSSHDIGSIDLVSKMSIDGGTTWSKLEVEQSYTEEIGKYGNPTLVFDEVNCVLNMAFMSATEANDYHYKTYNVQGTFDDDLNISWGIPKEIDFQTDVDDNPSGTDGVRSDTYMVGPGKGEQLKYGDKAGRLIIPTSNNGESFVLYSDDFGDTWIQGGSAGTGNECEAVELSNGELVMVVRDSIGCTTYHPEQYQRLSYSNDSGETWYKKNIDTSLRSPICMVSIDILSNGELVMCYPDSFTTRVNLTIAGSKNNGDTFISNDLLYAGASGYSCMTVDSDDNIYILAEIGKVNYNEVLVFIKVNR